MKEKIVHCQNCGNEFQGVLDEDFPCPECGSYNTSASVNGKCVSG